MKNFFKKYLFFFLVLIFLFLTNIFCTDFFDSVTWIKDGGDYGLDFSWSPDGRFLAVGANVDTPTSELEDLTIYEWDGFKLTYKDKIAFPFQCYAVDWSPDGRFLIAGGTVGIATGELNDLVIYEWNGSSLIYKKQRGYGVRVMGLSWNPNGIYLAVAGNKGNEDLTVYGWDGSIFTQKDTKSHGTQARSVSWSQDGKYLAVVGNNAPKDLIVYEWNGSILTEKDTKNYADYAESVDWSPDGRFLAVGAYNGIDDLIVYSWNGSSLAQLDTKDFSGRCESVSWSQDGKYLAAGGLNGPNNMIVYEWNGSSLVYKTQKTHGIQVMGVSWSPDGKYLAVTGENGTEDFILYRRFGYIDGTKESRYFYNNYFFNNDGFVSGDVNFANGITVEQSKTVVLNLLAPIKGKIDLNNSATIELESDLYLGSDAYFYDGGKICGNGNALFLSGNFTTSTDSVIHISSDTIIDGQYNNFELGKWSQIFVDTDVTLTLRNLTLKNMRNNQGFPPVRLAAHGSKLALDNVVIAPNCDFYFPEGQLFIYNDVSFTGTHRFIYNSTQPSRIMSQATWSFEPNTSFYYDTASSYSTDINLPSSTLEKPLHNELMIMEDDTSSLYLNNCTFQISHTGFRLTKGRMFIDDNVIIKNDETYTFSYLTTTTYTPFGSIAYSADWDPEGKLLAVAGDFGTNNLIVYAFNGSSLLITDSRYHGNIAYSVDWSPDGEFIAVGGECGDADVGVYYWDWTKQRLTFIESQSYGSAAYVVKWSLDNKYLVVGGDYSTNDLILYSWDGTDLSVVTSQHHGRAVYALDWHPDGKYLAVGGENSTKDLIIYEWSSGTETFAEKTYLDFGITVSGLSWSPDGRYLAVAGDNDFTNIVIYEWSEEDLIITASQHHGTVATSVDWSGDGRYIAVGGNYGAYDVCIYGFDGFILNLIAQKSHGAGAREVKFSDDGKYFAAVGQDNISPFDKDVVVCNVNYLTENYVPSYNNGFIMGDSSKGSEYDLNIFILGGSNLDMRGTVFYDV